LLALQPSATRWVGLGVLDSSSRLCL